jgi:hypothetical protein
VDLFEGVYAMTPLGWACYGSENGWYRDTGDFAGAAQALIEAGAEAPPKMEEFTATDAVRDVITRYTRVP